MKYLSGDFFIYGDTNGKNILWIRTNNNAWLMLNVHHDDDGPCDDAFIDYGHGCGMGILIRNGKLIPYDFKKNK